MRTIHIIILVIALFILVPASALIAAESAQYTHTITVNDKGVTMVDMGDHSIDLDTVNENDQTIPSIKITGYNGSTNNNTPVELPHTAVGYGDYTCTLTQHGNSFTVTQTTPCE